MMVARIYDHKALRLEYITSDMSIRELARQVGAASSTITRVAKLQRWDEARQTFRTKAEGRELEELAKVHVRQMVRGVVYVGGRPKKQAICANSVYRRLGGLGSVETSDGRPVVGILTLWELSVSGKLVMRRRGLCAICIKRGEPWAERQAAAARKEGRPPSTITMLP